MEHCLRYAFVLVTQFVIGYCWFYLLSESLDHHFGSIWRPLGPFWHHFGDQVGHRCAQSNPGRSQDGFWMMTESAPWAVYVRQFRAKPLCEGGFGGNRFGVAVLWVSFWVTFFSVFFSVVPNHFFARFGCPLGCFWVTFRVHFDYPWN